MGGEGEGQSEGLATNAGEALVDLTTKIETPTVEMTAEPKPETETAEQVSEVIEDEGDGEQEQKKRPSGSQRLKRRLELIESDFLQTQRELEAYRQREREAKERTNNPDAKPGIDRAPTEADYPNDWFAYQEAKTAWTARQAIREEFNRVRDDERRSSSERIQSEYRRERLEAYQEFAGEVRERIPDFDTVLAKATAPVKQDVIDEIMSSDKSALLQYHLAKNPDKVKELNSLSGRELAREIGRLEARVHLPKPKTATEANPPPKEVRGGAAPPVNAQTGPDDMNAYVAWRKKQMAS